MSGFGPRSALFVPGNRADMLAKVERSRPDSVIVDLEDAVPADLKDEARARAFTALAAQRPEVATVLVRVNGAGTPWFRADLAAAAAATRAGALDGIVLPKYERTEQLALVRAALPAGAVVVVGVESVPGVADARALLMARPNAVYFGAEDFIADMGGRRTPAGNEVLYARSQVCLAARLAGVAALDQATVAVRDLAAFRADAEQGRALGYTGKICLHPDQVEVAHEVFTPSPAEIEHARQVLAAAADGVGMVDGLMVDGAHQTMARELLSRAGGGRA
jgi:citrate lyase subunit beta/citryl-CoA lyase